VLKSGTSRSVRGGLKRLSAPPEIWRRVSPNSTFIVRQARIAVGLFKLLSATLAGRCRVPCHMAGEPDPQRATALQRPIIG